METKITVDMSAFTAGIAKAERAARQLSEVNVTLGDAFKGLFFVGPLGGVLIELDHARRYGRLRMRGVL